MNGHRISDRQEIRQGPDNKFEPFKLELKIHCENIAIKHKYTYQFI